MKRIAISALAFSLLAGASGLAFADPPLVAPYSAPTARIDAGAHAQGPAVVTDQHRPNASIAPNAPPALAQADRRSDAQRTHDLRYFDERTGYVERDSSAQFHAAAYRPPLGNSHWRARDWSEGQRLPANMRTRHYVLSNPAQYQLREPRAGYQWVRVNNDAALITHTSGVIRDVVANVFSD